MAQPWHKIYTEEYEDAVLEAAGAIRGWTAGKGEDGPTWTEASREAFRHAVACAFDQGFETRVRVDFQKLTDNRADQVEGKPADG
jgi:hypothetical protein